MKIKFPVVLAALLLGCFMATAFAANFTVDVKIGSASAGTSLTFGAGSAQEQPFPPVSLMFGVKDIFLANPANFTADADVSGDLSRLAVDVRSGATQWVIVANSDATLYFDKSSGAPKLYYGALVPNPEMTSYESGLIYEEGGELGASLSVTAGAFYTISTAGVTEANVARVSDDETNITIYAVDLDGSGAFTNDWTPAPGAASDADTLHIAATSAGIFFTDGDKYWSLDDGTSSATAPESYSALITVDGATISALSNYALSISGTPSELSLSAGSTAQPLTTTLANGAGKISAITWIVKTFGTLDFDQNGVVDFNDTIFFYNFVTQGGSAAELSAADLMLFAEETANLEAEAQTALDYLNAKEASLALDGTTFESIDDLYDSAIYFYNYITQGGAAAELTPADISLFTVDPDDTDKAQVALDKIQSLTNE